LASIVDNIEQPLLPALRPTENPATTSRYDRRSEAAKQRAVDLVHIPYVGRSIQDAPTAGGR